MDAARRRGGLLVVGVAAVVVVADRLTKLWALASFQDRPREILGGIVTLRVITNSGGAFSVGDRAPLLFALAAIAVSMVIVATAFRPRPRAHAIALGLILGGAVGNLVDRVARGPWLSGEVVDFIDPHVWPVFNVADTAIVCGALLLAAIAIRDGRRADAG